VTYREEGWTSEPLLPRWESSYEKGEWKRKVRRRDYPIWGKQLSITSFI
jgi:hypothetical protein